MKRTIIIGIMLLFISSAFTQEIITDSSKGKTIVVNGNGKEQKEVVCVHSVGEYVNIPAVTGGIYAQALGWGISECSFQDKSVLQLESINLLYRDHVGYKDFDQESRILIRFTDDYVSTLYRDVDSAVETSRQSLIPGNPIYITYVRFNLDKETRKRMMNPTLGIKKIRIVFTNGEIQDYNIKGNKQYKFLEQLRKSYKNAEKDNAERMNNSDDASF